MMHFTKKHTNFYFYLLKQRVIAKITYNLHTTVKYHSKNVFVSGGFEGPNPFSA